MQRFIIGWLMISLFLGPYGCALFKKTDESPSKLSTPREPVKKEKPLESKKEMKEQRIQPDDILIITIWEHPELSRERTVSPEGHLRLPFLGELKVANLTITELEKILIEEMTPYLKKPIISVEYKARVLTKKITVLGAVANQSNYEFPRDKEIKLSFLLGASGGYTEWANLETVSIIRTDPQTSSVRKKIQVNVKDIIFRPLTEDITLQDNDVVIVEQKPSGKWNTTIQKVTPTLQVIALIASIAWFREQILDD